MRESGLPQSALRRPIAEADARGDITLVKELRRQQDYEVVDVDGVRLA